MPKGAINGKAPRIVCQDDYGDSGYAQKIRQKTQNLCLRYAYALRPSLPRTEIRVLMRVNTPPDQRSYPAFSFQFDPKPHIY